MPAGRLGLWSELVALSGLSLLVWISLGRTGTEYCFLYGTGGACQGKENPDPRQEYLGQHCFVCVPAMSFPARLLLSHPADTLVSEKQGTSLADLWLCEALSPTLPYPSAQLAHASMVLVAGL